jgi:hypothetical protein
MARGHIYNKDSYIGKYCGAHDSAVQSLPSQASSNVHRKVAESNIKSSTIDQLIIPKKKKTKPEEADI